MSHNLQVSRRVKKILSLPFSMTFYALKPVVKIKFLILLSDFNIVFMHVSCPKIFFFIFPVLRKYTYKYLSETYNQKRYKAKMQDFFFDTLSVIPNEGLKLQNIRNHTNHNLKSIDL